jgi:polyhydroxyalkanoate synthase
MIVPDALTIRGVPIDLRKIKTPMYLEAAQDDHIAPFPSVFKATRTFAGPIRFMLAGSGHIAGVVNPPAAQKYKYWTNPKLEGYPSAEAWFADAKEHPGSWWPDWHQWLSKRSGKKVPARVPGEGQLRAIEDAPGSYVRVRSDKAKPKQGSA